MANTCSVKETLGAPYDAAQEENHSCADVSQLRPTTINPPAVLPSATKEARQDA
jgi:hypothetical protein